MTDTHQGQIVFTEIPITDEKRACGFYETLLGAPLSLDENGPNPIWMLPSMDKSHAAGHLYPGKPARDGEGITAHFAVTGELAAAMDRVKKGGGEVVSDVIAIPVGAFFYAKDTEGNSLGIFKYTN